MKIYSSTWNCFLFGWRILSNNNIFVWSNWLCDSFAIYRSWQVWYSYCEAIETFVRCVALFIRIKNTYKFHKRFLIRNSLKMERLQNYAKQCHCSKIFELSINYWKDSFVEFYVFWRNYKIWLLHGIVTLMVHQNDKTY